jgi:hypothetical protein
MPAISESPAPDWLSIRRCAELGVPLKTLAEKFGVTWEAVRKRNQRENWLTPSKLAEIRAEKTAAVTPKSQATPPAELVTGTIAEMGQELQTTVLSKTLAALRKADFASLPIASWQDAKTAVDVGLKAAGLDSAQVPAVNIMLNAGNSPDLVEIEALESVPRGTIQAQEDADIL